MRWDGQRLDRSGEQALLGLTGLVRSVTSPEFDGVTFHEIRARSALNKVGGSAMPFRWTVNPYRGCSHACTYCFARRTHTYLDFDSGRDFDTQVVVKTNVAEVLATELAKPGWAREHVAMGTNTDPYQRAEGRYRLMPGIIRALARSGTGFSILTKGTVLTRDLPLLRSAAAEVGIGVGVSIALLDRDLQRRLEPGTPSPRARLDLVRRARDAGLSCGVFVAPVLPGLTDSEEALDALLAAVAEAGATGVTALPLHLRPGAREWFASWLAAEYPGLIGRYRDIYGDGTYACAPYRRFLSERIARLVRRHGLEPRTGAAERGVPGDGGGQWPAGVLPAARRARGDSEPARPEQLSLL
ncbi:radical SAM protein [Amycolatopsis antarctica]|uniref:Radical SAM protein n=1 Tax=Amycolatopsis antarctica TaxID=1854586 RepID=A0A263D3I1_9PSEU|nr:Rv2578c family radical SAM protein [Amycolatopsis antarctica]OZM73034.1 radical SAM protein [Amycolatopsis antarctica]